MNIEFVLHQGSIGESEDAPQGIIMASISDGSLLDVNSGFEVTTGYSRKEAIGQTLQSLGLWADDAEYSLMYSELRNSGEILNKEFTLKRKDGTPHSALFSAYLIELAGQSFLVFVLDDLTDRRRTEEALRVQKAYFEQLFDSSPEAIAILDAKDRVMRVNAAFERLFEYAQEEVAGRSINDLIAPGPALDDAKTVSRAVITEGKVVQKESVRYRKNGIPLQVSIVGYPILSNGKQIGAFAIYRDITARRQVNAEMQSLAAAIDQAGESIITTDSKGAIEYVNPAFERLTGYSREEAMGKNPCFVGSGKQDRSFYTNLWETITAGNTWSGRMVNRRKDGTLYTVDCTISPVFGSEGEIDRFVAVEKDITAELRLEEDLRQAQRMESVGRLAAGVAHDFNNLLSPILGYAELLLQELRPPDQRFHHAQEIQKAAQRARGLTRQLLSFGRKQMLQIQPVDLNQVATDIERLMQRALREDIELVVLPTPEPCIVMADVGQVEQILMNLAVNAQDAMPSGGKLTVEITRVELDTAYTAQHPDSKPGRYGALSVTDTGCGMDEETKLRIFEPFFSTKGERGTGLGLATVYGIVKQQGGNIWVYSEPGKGTIFRIYLPAAEDAAVPADKGTELPAALHGAETILLVEDDQMVRDLTHAVLEKQGYTVLSAASGVEALRILQGHARAVDLLLTDVVMPEMNGKELFAEALKHRPGIKALFMSGYTDNVIVHHGVLEPDVQFLQKPFSVHGLASKVRQVLDEDPL